jgi:Tfp pilus assembly protein PilF
LWRLLKEKSRSKIAVGRTHRRWRYNVREGHYSAAEQMFRFALKEAEKFGEHDLRLAHTLNNLALACCNQGKHEEACEYRREEVALPLVQEYVVP